MPDTAPMLELRDVEVRFDLKRTNLFGAALQLRAVDGVSLSLQRGQTMAVVGESGSGKTTLALAIARLIPVTTGKIRMGDVDLLGLQGESLRTHRRHMQFIFQDPYSSLNPRLRAKDIVREPLDRLSIGSVKSRNNRVQELFEQVGLRQDQLRLFPHQFSGGQRQRIGIARAIASSPSLVICDEPVSALDVGVQAQILNLLRRLQKDLNLTYLFISHDLGVVQHMCDSIAVMYMGKIVEQADPNIPIPRRCCRPCRQRTQIVETGGVAQPSLVIRRTRSICRLAVALLHAVHLWSISAGRICPI